MGYDEDGMGSTPKLPLFSYSRNRGCPTPGLATPPVNIGGSVPFLWEEAPGKPRSNHTKGKRDALDLPPRLEPCTNDLRRPSQFGSTTLGCFRSGCTKVKLSSLKRKASPFSLSHTTNSDFWARVYQGFRQVIPWRRKQENLHSRHHFFP